MANSPKWVNLMASTPLVANFDTTQGSGTPINIDNSTGKAYYLSSSNVVIPFTGELIDIEFFGGVADDATDCRAACVAGIAFLSARGGGTLRFSGKYFISGSVALAHNITILGDGKASTIIRSSHAGTGVAKAGAQSGSIFYNEDAINSSTAANIRIAHLRLTNTNGANIGAGFYDQGGSFITLENVEIRGFKYGIIFDQTELADIEFCTIQSQLLAGVWLVNGTDLNPAASGQFTNRIGIKSCQFNEGTTVYGILDDGGVVRSFEDNNYNGCLNHIRLAGANGVKISGGEFESAAAACIKFDALTLAGAGAGSCLNVYIGGGAMFAPAVGQNCILINNLGNILLDGVYFGNTAVAKVNGAVNANSIIAFNVFNAGGGATFSGTSTSFFHVGNNGTAQEFLTNILAEFTSAIKLTPGSAPATLADGQLWYDSVATKFKKREAGVTSDLNAFVPLVPAGVQFVFDDAAGSGYQSYEEHISASPYRVHRIVSKGGAGTWQGAIRAQVSYNGGALFDAFVINADTSGTTASVGVTGSFAVSGITTSASYKVGANQVVGAQGAAVADSAAFTSVNATNAAAAPTQAEFNAFVAEFNKLRTDTLAIRTQLNLALARLRAATGHGLIA